MGIGRREFLKLFGGLIATAVASPLQAVIISDDFYINRVLGLAYKKPEGWFFISLEAFAEIKERQQLIDSETAKSLKKGNDPIALLSKYPESSGISFSPSITIYVEHFELVLGENLIDLVSTLANTYAKALISYQFIERPQGLSVSRCDAVEFTATFLHQEKEKEALCRHRSIVVVRDLQMYTVNVFDYPELGLTIDEEYLEFKDGFKLV